MDTLKNKNILFLAPNFFGYEFEIKKTLESLGANVFYFDERPKNDFLTKVLIRLNIKKLIQEKINRYYNQIITTTKSEKLDYLFLIAPETIDERTINKIKKLHKDIKVYIYMWDSIENKKTALSLLDISDKFLTFDRQDKHINNKIDFLPLFYINSYQEIANERSDFKYDLSFIGTIHSDRYKIVKQIEKIATANNITTYFYFYSPSKVLFSLQRLLLKDFKHIDKKDVSFISLKKEDVLNIMKNSKAIIDIHHPHQSGLTMRTIEVLGAKRKLFTTNEDIKHYDFYNEKNIYIFDRNNPNIDASFLNSQYEDAPTKVYDKYSIKEWVHYIFK